MSGSVSSGRAARPAAQARGLTDDSDELLARSAALGDRTAFDELVRRTLPSLLRYALRMTPDKQTAEDVVQETLLAAWRGVPSFGFESSFRTWAFAIAHRKIVDLRRRRQPAPVDDAFEWVPASQPGPAESAVTTSMSQALERELAALPHVSRAVWWLREMEGLSHPEIARAVGIPASTIRGHLQRSRSRLVERMEPWRPSGMRPSRAPTSNTTSGRRRHVGETRSQERGTGR